MRIGLNLVALTRTGAGIGRYVRELIPAMLAEEPDLQLTAFHSRELPDDVRGAPWAEAVEWVGLPLNVTHGPPWNLATNIAAQWAVEPALARRRRLSVLHGPANLGPLTGGGAARVVTIFDLIWLHHRGSVSRMTAMGMRALVPVAARAAECVIVASRSARRDVVGSLGVPARNIEVVPLGAGLRADPAGPDEATLRASHELGDRPVILCVAQQRPHKNLAMLLRAFALIRDANAVLVLPGEPTPGEIALRALADELGVAERVRFIGWVGDGELDALYRLASVVVAPSLEEGFGLPVLEAMARGVPVACSTIPAFAEVAGDAALRFDPRDAPSIAAALDRLDSDRNLRASLIALGRARAEQFTWQSTARRTLAAYRKAIEQRGVRPRSRA